NPEPTPLTMIPMRSKASRRRALRTVGTPAAGRPPSAIPGDIDVDIVVADGQLAIDEVAVVLREEAGDRDVVAGERHYRRAVAPEGDDLDLASGGVAIEVTVDHHAFVAGGCPERGDAGLLDIAKIGVMVSGANLATPASGDHGPELLFVTTLAVRQV